MEANDLRRLMEEQLRLSRKLKARIRELEEAQSGALAVVGMAMRLPGELNTPDAFWQFLRVDASVLSEIPDERPGLRSVYDPRPDQPGRSYVDKAGFLRDIASFDAAFFGISQREAESLDPQQRMLLETAWEAMERAGIAARRQDRIEAGVFIGIMASEYGERFSQKPDKRGIDPYYGTGGGHCFAAGRISYALGLSGPALSVDTACSSSLVALHLGAQSLRRRECAYALVGGSNLILSPDLMVSLCQSKALAKDGRSKTFTAAADGYGRGEGVGMLVLMRLDDALREQRPVLAVVRGTALNHDGASSGLTVPSGPAQQDVIRAALRDARVEPQDVGYVEAHGTGTSLGDPIEVVALDQVVGSGVADRPAKLALGSLKVRLGHLEAAAGVAGLMKLVLMLQHREIPPSLSEADGELNPLIPWSELQVAVPRRIKRWPSVFERQIAGISAFGLSGTNAHAVLESARCEPVAETKQSGSELLTLSAKDPKSLGALADAVCTYLSGLDPKRFASACHTLRAGRVPFACRITAIAATPAEMAEKIRMAARAYERPRASAGVLMTSLRVSVDGEALEASLRALLEVYPALGLSTEGLSLPPEKVLDAALAALGVRTKLASAQLAPGILAEIGWGAETHALLTQDPNQGPELLRAALSAIYLSGADLRLEALAAEGARYLGDLPTYAFQRKRYWIDEVAASQQVQEAGMVDEGPSTVSRPVERRAARADDVHAFLRRELVEVLRCEDTLDLTASFLEVGGDSFTAMLLKKSVEQQYGVEIPLEELAVELTLESLIARMHRSILAGLGSSVSREEQIA